jgi:hypothetical protein
MQLYIAFIVAAQYGYSHLESPPQHSLMTTEMKISISKFYQG